MKKLLKILFSRAMFVALFMVLQAAVIFAALTYFSDNVAAFYTVFILIAVVAVIYILNDDTSNSATRMAWIILIMVLPLFGTATYFLFGRTRMSAAQRERVLSTQSKYNSATANLPSKAAELRALSPEAALQSRYLEREACAPVYARTQTEYLWMGETLFPRMLEALRGAKRFIFLEYFIVAPGRLWDEILSVLEEKAAAGVDVRLIYDDIGSILTLPRNYAAQLEKKGVRCCVFRRFHPVLSGSFNNRDHRKICVVDGDVAFTGGMNLADEYANYYAKYGRWADSGVMLQGDAAFSFTAMFLSMWDSIRREDDDLAAFAPERAETPEPVDGYVQPFGDTPMDDEAVGETAYINMISRARKYVWITTPYLVIDGELMNALCAAAKSGVDVRLVTPGVPDKRMVFAVTRSYYAALIRAGVRIFEYTPGFMHAKGFVSDDEVAICGSINLDYRSLYLHYECAVWMFRCRAVTQMRDAFKGMLPECAEITGEYCRSRSWLLRLVQSLLRVFAPMM